MGWICKWFRKRKKEEWIPEWKNPMNMCDADVKLFCDTQLYILESSKKYVRYNGHLQTLAEARTLKQETLNLGRDEKTGIGTLHWFFPGDAKPYIDAQCFVQAEELANKGITNDLNTFKKSPSHNQHLISGEYDYLAVSNRGEYCVILLAKDYDKVYKAQAVKEILS